MFKVSKKILNLKHAKVLTFNFNVFHYARI